MNFEAWFPSHIHLTGFGVMLRPLQEVDVPALVAAAADPRIWEFYSFDGSKEERMRRFLQESLAEAQTGQRCTLVVLRNGEPVGTSSFYECKYHYRNLEIGYTWLNPSQWGQRINERVKFLMLQHCFEGLQLLRVQFKTWEKNERSRRALTKIGASYEGALRNHMIRENGEIRTSHFYSILLEEWPVVKANLLALIDERPDVT